MEKLNIVRLKREHINAFEYYPFDCYDDLIFLGEIPNMPEHCVLIDKKTGKIHYGYHTENFYEIDDE